MRGVPLCQLLFRERVRQLHGDGGEKLDHRLIDIVGQSFRSILQPIWMELKKGLF